MKLYTSVGSNPRVVKMFIAEKGIDVPRQVVDLRGGENRREDHLKRNPTGQLPTLELDSGEHLSEIIAICEYLEELHPEPVLIGATPKERAMTRMWTRRVDLHVAEPMLEGFRSSEGYGLFKDRVRVLPAAADHLKLLAQEWIAWFNVQMTGREYVAGPRFTLADILLFCTLDFGAQVGQAFNRDHAAIAAWYDRIAARPSATISKA